MSCNSRFQPIATAFNAILAQTGPLKITSFSPTLERCIFSALEEDRLIGCFNHSDLAARRPLYLKTCMLKLHCNFSVFEEDRSMQRLTHH